MNKHLVRKYNVQGPRYTSYPPVPSWNPTSPTEAQWKTQVSNTFHASNQKDGISLYIHLPYCESLCTYCGCNTRITVNHAVERPYIDSLLSEWKLYLELFDEKPKVSELHLGGGTPTFFSEENLKLLIEEIFNTVELIPDAELGFEGHPNNTTKEHLRVLGELGFKRLSLGIQDFSPKVQKAINRIQSSSIVQEVTENARSLGYSSINYDLIYGLPFQTQESVQQTILEVGQLSPDRIAFYSYAHVPWIKPGQRMFTEMDLPDQGEKRALYELGKEMLETLGYSEIGMDHFALSGDPLFEAFQTGQLHRNFMGYTPRHTKLVIGLGASAISDTWISYGQNIKSVEQYREVVGQGKFPIFKGHQLDLDELNLRTHISNLMCQFETSFQPEFLYDQNILMQSTPKLEDLVDDELITFDNNRISITQAGRPFIRNVCMAIDTNLQIKTTEKQRYSKVV